MASLNPPPALLIRSVSTLIPSQILAHPHMSGSDFALVHNGIIGNYRELRHELISQGYCFNSQTDSEVIVHLLAEQYKKMQPNLLTAVQMTIQQSAVKHLLFYIALSLIVLSPT